MGCRRRLGFVLGLALMAGAPPSLAQAPPRPARSSPIAVTPDGARVWVVNPDSDSVSVLETATDTLVSEIPVGTSPATLAVSPDGTRVLVANRGSNDLSVIDASALTEIARPFVGAQPYGVTVRPDGARIYVALGAEARVVSLDPATLATLASIPTAPRPRGVAVTADSSRVVVTHFLTPAPSLNATVSVIDTAANAVAAVVPLPLLPGLPGVANFLTQAVIRPGTPQAWIPMVQMETGNPDLQLRTTVHAAFAVVDVIQQLEPPGTRTHLERILNRVVSQPTDMDFRQGVVVSFMVNMASDDMEILAAGTRTQIGTVIDVGSAPQGIAVTPDGTRAYVSNYLGRSVTVVSVADPAAATVIGTVPVTSRDPLPADILNGKRLFFTARGRMSTDRWIACISCHPGGGMDGRDWNFTRGGEGIRNTTDIRGIVDSGAVHWTANMDELQDLEFNIRNLQFGPGLIDGVPNDPFGPPNAGRSQDLDDFAAFMDSMLKGVRGNPNRAPGGGLTPAGARGKTLFESSRTGCASCHRGSSFTDSDRATLVVHDVGTLAPGDVNGQQGFDTPSLLDLFESAPYLHDGSAPTLLAVLTARNPQDRHGVTSTLTPAERNDLVAYLLQLDNDRDEMSAASITALPGAARVPLLARDVSLTRLNATDARPGGRIWGFDVSLSFPPAGVSAVSVIPAGATAGLPVRSIDDPPADLTAGRKVFSIRFDAPVPLAPNPPAPGELIGYAVFELDPVAVPPSVPVGMTPEGTALTNDTGSKSERPVDGNLLVVGGSLAIGTPEVSAGVPGSPPLTVTRIAGGDLRLDWEAITGASVPVAYNVYRGTLAAVTGSGAYDHVCLQGGLASSSATFPPGGPDAYYLVTATAGGGYGEGPAGVTSAGTPVPLPAPCP